MRKYLLAVVLPTLLFAACGEPKTVKLNRMYLRSGSGQYYVEGTVQAVGDSIVRLKVGEVEYSNLRLRDDTGEYTFHFLPSEHTRQPVTGDNVKCLAEGGFATSSFGGSPTAQVIRKFEFK